MEYREQIVATIEEQWPELEELKNWMYENPETALQEYATADYLCRFLEKKGFEVERGVAGLDTSFVARKKNGSGRRVALMPEYDALPELGQGCGHHLIAESCIGAALGLSAAMDEGLEGELYVVGAPAEETGDGKPPMADHGYYDNFDACVSAHPSNQTKLEPKWISIGGMDFTFKGKAAHAGSNPSDGVNALDALFVFYSAFSALRQELRDETRIHGIIMEGGSAANIIPDNCRIRLEFRSPDHTYYGEVEQKVVRCAKGAALATGCELEYHNYEPTCVGVKHNHILSQEYGRLMESYGVEIDNEDFIGSTDVGNVSVVSPTIHPLFKITDLGYGLHTQSLKEATMTMKADRATMINAKVMAELLLKVMTDDEFADAAMAEFKK